MALQGEPLDRGTMCRVAEDVGASLGAIMGASLGAIVLAARDEAMATAFCLSTDATGVAIQPTPLADGKRQPCRKGHFFVILADNDHVFFEYQPRHTSAAVCEMFRGFSGYIQADAHAVYDALFRGPSGPTLFDEATGPPLPSEVGCWSHYPESVVIWSVDNGSARIGLDCHHELQIIIRSTATLETSEASMMASTVRRVCCRDQRVSRRTAALSASSAPATRRRCSSKKLCTSISSALSFERMLTSLSAAVAVVESVAGQGEQFRRSLEVGFRTQQIDMPKVSGKPRKVAVQVHTLVVPARESVDGEGVAQVAGARSDTLSSWLEASATK
jgi:hypothetical protein